MARNDLCMYEIVSIMVLVGIIECGIMCRIFGIL
jgi:hypothetical protein